MPCRTASISTPIGWRGAATYRRRPRQEGSHRVAASLGSFQDAARSRSVARTSATGVAPNMRPYSRVNCGTLS